MKITENFLNKNPNYIFVFGDNLKRRGHGGAAKLRDHPQTYGFVTKKAPNNNPESFYRPNEYEEKFQEELNKLKEEIKTKTECIFLISKIGSGLANKYGIYETIIEPRIQELKIYKNVVFLDSNKN